jgi:hypothetical protein
MCVYAGYGVNHNMLVVRVAFATVKNNYLEPNKQADIL